MRVRLGPFEFDIEIENPSSSDILNLKLKEIINAKSVTLRQDPDHSENTRDFKVEVAEKQFKNTQTPGPKGKDYSTEMDILHAAGFTNKTIVQIGNKVLGIQAVQSNLNKDFGLYEKAAKQFLSRPIDDEIWALFAAPLSLPGEDLKVVILGLNKDNQMVILSIKDNPPAKAFRDVISRGLDPSKIQLGILSFHLGATEEFKEMFPEALIQLDWKEYTNLVVGAEERLRFEAASNAKSKTDVETTIKSIKAPRELLTYLDYPQSLQRAIKTTSAIKRMQKDIALRLRKRPGLSKELKGFLIVWSLIRIQFQWLRTPVDSDQLTHLKYIKSHNDTLVE